ncbi:MAG TPA: hypothetical protein PLP26_06740 [Ilumatobacteraceae bacterium]|nr:hypothetical protein [Ilumatobacteraceae bacterium]
MTIVNGYASGEDLAAWRGGATLTDTEPDIERAIEAASRWVDLYCGQHFFAVDEARIFIPSDGYALALKHMNPLTAITTLKTDDGSGAFATTWQTTDYELLPIASTAPQALPFNHVHAIGGQTFPIPMTTLTARQHLVKIDGTWGWPAVPEAVIQATIIVAHGIIARRNSPGGLAGGGDFGMVRVPGYVDPTARQLLAPYQYAAGVGIA